MCAKWHSAELLCVLRDTVLTVMCVQPCKLRDWELHVHFKIHGDAQDLYGDGLAIWYTKHRMELGNVTHSVLC